MLCWAKFLVLKILARDILEQIACINYRGSSHFQHFRYFAMWAAKISKLSTKHHKAFKIFTAYHIVKWLRALFNFFISNFLNIFFFQRTLTAIKIKKTRGLFLKIFNSYAGGVTYCSRWRVVSCKSMKNSSSLL